MCLNKPLGTEQANYLIKIYETVVQESQRKNLDQEVNAGVL